MKAEQNTILVTFVRNGIQYRDSAGQTIVFGLLQEKIENQGDAWTMAVDSVGRFYERVMAKGKAIKLPDLINKPALHFEDTPEELQEFIGRGFYERIARLGQRTAEMHLALASDADNEAFAPQAFSQRDAEDLIGRVVA